jgi:ABC-2 type transport system permease protein
MIIFLKLQGSDVLNFSRIKGIFFRYFYVLLKGPQQLSDLFYWPLIDILLWGLTSIWFATVDQSSDLPLMLMTGLIFWQITWRGSVDISVSLLQEFWHRNLINLFVTPLKLVEWSLGVILLCLCKLCVTVSFGVLLVYLLYSLKIYTIGWVFIPFALMLLVFGWTLGFLAASFLIRFGHQLESIAWMIGYLFAPFSAVFYPVSVLPSWAQNISWALPTTYVFEGMRAILQGHCLPSHYIWVSLSLNICYFSFSLWLFSSFLRKSREKGLARLE